MLRTSFRLCLIFALNLSTTSIIFAETAENISFAKPKIFVTGCRKAAQYSMTQLEANDRFILSKQPEKSAIRMQWECRKNSLRVSIFFPQKHVRFNAIHGQMTLEDGVEKTTTLLLSKVIKLLPWEAEISAITHKSPLFVKLASNNYQQYFAKGSSSEPLAAAEPCRLFEIVEVDEKDPFKFSTLGFGVSETTPSFNSDVKIFISKSLIGKNLLLAFPLNQKVASTPPISTIAEECQARASNQVANNKDDTPPAHNLISSPNEDAGFFAKLFSIDALSQHFSVFSSKFKSSEGQDSGNLIAVGGENNVALKYAFLDIKVIMSIISTDQDTGLGDSKTYDPKLTHVEAVAGPRIKLDNLVLQLGLGAVMTNMNNPYKPQGATSFEHRGTVMLPSVFLKANYTFNDSYSAGVRSYFGKSADESELGGALNLNYHLSSSWRIGLEYQYLKLSEDRVSKAPSTELTSVGMLVGFGLGK